LEPNKKALAFLLKGHHFMKKYFRYLLPAIAILFLFGTMSSGVSAQGVLKEILKRMDTNNASLVSLKSNIKIIR